MRLRVYASSHVDSPAVSATAQLFCLLRGQPSKPMVWQELLGNKEAHSVCVLLFCLVITEREISLVNFSIHGENWSCVFHRRSSDWDTNFYFVVERKKGSSSLRLSSLGFLMERQWSLSLNTRM